MHTESRLNVTQLNKF